MVFDWLWRCALCGRFMRHEEAAVDVAPHDGYTLMTGDLDPPDPAWAHRICALAGEGDKDADTPRS